jgi:hypothetical protein
MCSIERVKYRVPCDPWSLRMDREWLTLRLLQIDIAVLVVIALAGIMAITFRLARDPSDSLVRWWQERGRMATPITPQPGSLPALTANIGPPVTEDQAGDSHLHTPEWLDRLIGRHHRGEERQAVSVQVREQPVSGRRVA